MRFQVTFEIHPSGPFGVPQDGVTVVSTQEGGRELLGDTYHVRTMTRVGYGSLPEYRKENQAINLSLNLGDVQISLRDNFAFADVEASSASEAYEKAAQTINRFLQHLSLSQGRLFTFQPLINESDDGKVFPVPTYKQIASVTVYDLKRLRNDVEQTQNYYHLSDQRLERALLYFAHAHLLFERRMEIAPPLSEHYTLLIASVFLHLWKAISVIVGDPSKDTDYQSRYKQFGLDYEFFKSRIEKIRNLRNNYDVAHYSLTEESIKEIEANFGEADQIVAEVLRRYREYLLKQGTISNV